MLRRAAIGIAAALLAGCASKPVPAPQPAPAAQPVAPERLVAAPAPPSADSWLDRPLTPGDWSYAGGAGDTEARFASLALRCDAARRQVTLSRDGASGPIRVLTSYGQRNLASGAGLPAGDPLLDEMAFSRGRFAVEADGLEMLVVPAWPEPARVVEDCRG